VVEQAAKHRIRHAHERRALGPRLGPRRVRRAGERGGHGEHARAAGRDLIQRGLAALGRDVVDAQRAADEQVRAVDRIPAREQRVVASDPGDHQARHLERAGPRQLRHERKL
jgi:hypothetical protein